MNPLLAALAALALLFAAGVAPAAPVAAGVAPVAAPHVSARLVAQTDAVAPGSTLYAAVILDADHGWHTYWRNPGDAGEATEIAWTLPAGWRAGPIVWPTPSRLPVGPIMNYGYEGRAVLAAPIEVPANASGVAHLAAKVDYLVCAQVCVPGEVDLALDLPVTATSPQIDRNWGGLIASTLARAPKPAGLDATFAKVGGALKLAVTGAPLAGGADADVYFYPYDDTLIDQAKAQVVDRGPRGLTLTLVPGAAFSGKSSPSTASGVLAVDGAAWEVTARPGPPPAGAAGLGPPARSAGLPPAMGLAFLGGLILNLMPCVFPILAMKAAGLARLAEAHESARREGLAFFLGVVVAFGALAGALIAARAAGHAVGWGFQLQSPLTIAVLALVMLGAALNLSGLFEIGTSIQGLGQGLVPRGRLLGAGFTGALAVVVAAPCTAPFMGPALGFALTQPTPAALSVFLALAVGFAAPYTLLAFVPGLAGRLPRPGPWMDVFRKLLAFPMYAAAAWLLWVLSQQTGPEGLARLLAAGVALAFCAWLYGIGQRSAEGRRRWPNLAAAASFVLALVSVVGAPFAPAIAKGPAAGAETLASQAWSPQRLAALRAQGVPVLVNFTAAWCVTCQVNERLALSSPEVARALKRSGAVYLVADWTNRDPRIAAALAAEGRIGVPLYLYYPPGAAAPEVLPQLLSPAILVDALAPRSARLAQSSASG